MDLGAFTAFLYGFREREIIGEIFEQTIGARLTMNYIQPGGLMCDIHPDFVRKVKEVVKYLRPVIDEYDVLLSGNVILQERLRNIGVLYVAAVGGLGVMGILLGGWSSNNKWSLIGSMRAAAQIISYEMSAMLALLVVVLYAGTMSLSGIVQSQAAGWWIWRAPGVGFVAFAIYVVASTAETNRTPFDIPEGESELTGGFHTEYSGLRFAFFFLAEFINMFVAAAVIATLFLGGWMPFRIGGLERFNAVMGLLPPGAWFLLKTSLMIFVLMWFRWTFPRLRVDQLMHLEWKVLLPIGLLNLVAAAVAVLCDMYFFPGR
jgi:NADH-quinone oxidoreductase subunit H